MKKSITTVALILSSMVTWGLLLLGAELVFKATKTFGVIPTAIVVGVALLITAVALFIGVAGFFKKMTSTHFA